MVVVRAVGYVRVAPRERRAARPDLAEQRDAVAAECARRGWELVGVEEDVRSGRTLRRPGLRRALEHCRGGRADAIVAARLDRLSYSLADLAVLIREASERGFNLVAPDLGLDLETSEGTHLATVLAVAATWHPRSLSGRTRSAFAARTLEGGGRGRPSSTPPQLAERIRALRAGGATLQGICDSLNAERIPTPRGGSHWRPSSLRAIVRPLARPEKEELP